MARGLRLLLTPIRREGTSGSVLGGRLALQGFGSGTTAALLDSPVAAKITFVASCFADARAPAPERQERELGSLVGELSLARPDAKPVFALVPADSTLLQPSATAVAPSQGKPRRLRLELEAASFSVPPDAPSFVRLSIPAELTEGARHLELLAKLELSGAVEGDETTNDVLDVPLIPRPVITLRVVDEVGEGIAGVPIDFGDGDAAESLVTDSVGKVSIDDLGLDELQATISDDAGLRAELKTRWKKARPGARLRDAPEVERRFLSSVLEPIELGERTSLKLSVQPRVTLARLLGMFFDTNKSFLLPSALPDISQLTETSEENPDSVLLVVGHTDTSADAATNDPLSLERAESTVAFLLQDVDTWLDRYTEKTTAKRRWGASEDFAMLQSLPDFFDRPEDEDPISFFQRTRSLTVDGKAGPETRRQLITEYMAREEPILPEDMDITAHGCGELFPLDASGEQLDPDPDDPQRDPVDRRVEIFFFEKELGIQPPPPGKSSKPGSTEYPEWRKRAELSRQVDLRLSDRVLRLRLQANDEAIVDEEYALDIDGRRVMVARTSDEGLVVQRLTVSAKLVEIRVPRLGLHRSIQLAPAEDFPSVDVLLGVQTRLAQLGFLAKEPDNKLDRLTRDALRKFRASRGLSAQPRLDADTRRALTEAYGS